MDILDFLDNMERRQVRIFQILLQNNGYATFSSLRNFLPSDRKTIKEDIFYLQKSLESCGVTIRVDLKKKEIFIDSSSNVTVSSVYGMYLRNSVKYKILITLLNKKGVTYHPLATQLSISLSTLNRRIKELNDLFSEYGIRIHLGKLVGPELSIRYFYFQLFWFGKAHNIYLSEGNDTSTGDLIQSIENKYQDIFTDEGKQKLIIWLYILKRRLRQTLNSSASISIDIDFSRVPIFEMFHVFFSQYFSRYAFRWNRNESQILFLFLLGNFTLNVDNPNVRIILDCVKSNDKVAQFTQLFYLNLGYIFPSDSLRPNYFSIISYTVIQIHYKCLFFPSYFPIWGNTNFENQMGISSEKKLHNICEKICDNILMEMEIQDEFKYQNKEELINRYHVLLSLAYSELNVSLRIGCNFQYESTMNELLMNRIRNKVDKKIKVSFESFKDTEQYDAILATDMFADNLSKTIPIFIIFSFEFETDFPKLNTFLWEQFRSKLDKRVKVN